MIIGSIDGDTRMIPDQAMHIKLNILPQQSIDKSMSQSTDDLKFTFHIYRVSYKPFEVKPEHVELFQTDLLASQHSTRIFLPFISISTVVIFWYWWRSRNLLSTPYGYTFLIEEKT